MVSLTHLNTNFATIFENNSDFKMFQNKISEFLDVTDYKETFEANLNKGKKYKTSGKMW